MKLDPDMKDDELLAALGKAAQRDLDRERLAGDAWEKLARGTISDEERRALEALAQDDAEAREGLQALAPMDAAAEARTLDRIAAARGKKSATDAAPATEGRVVALPPRRARPLQMAWLAAAAAIAAVVGFSVLRPHATGELPEYAMEVTGQDRPSRGAEPAKPDEPMRVHVDSPIAIVLRPKASTQASIDVRVSVERDGHASASTAAVEIAPTGAVRIAARADALLGAVPGRVDVVVGIGAPPREQSFRVRFDVQP